MKPLPHQIKAAKKLKKKLSRHNLAILAGQPRSGKTISFLEVAKDYRHPLIITQKSAIADIQKHTDAVVTNYHQVKNLTNIGFDLVIIDECHRFIANASPKRSQIWRDIRTLTQDVPIIFSSGTLTPEGYAGLFNMLSLSDYSPWKRFTRFTQWYQEYGRPYQMQINGLYITKYDRTQEEKILHEIKKYTVSITRKEAGHVHEATDRPVSVPLTRKQQKVLAALDEDQLFADKNGVILADTPAKMLTKSHQICGGFVHGESGYLKEFKKKPKISWLQKNIDPDRTIILAHYIEEQKLLASLFPHTGSITKNAEGVNLSHFDRMVIYSMSFSAATYEQVRARQMNFSRKKPIEIIYLLSGIDAYIYKAVQQKKNFTASWYRRNR